MKRILVFSLLIKLVFLCGCYKNGLYVQQEKIDPNFLASARVGSPDPRQADPPKGQRLLIGWNLPLQDFQENLRLTATVRLWDQTQETFIQPLNGRRGTWALYFPQKEEGGQKRILTYIVEVVTEEGEAIATWEHPFWIQLINPGR